MYAVFLSEVRAGTLMVEGLAFVSRLDLSK